MAETIALGAIVFNGFGVAAEEVCRILTVREAADELERSIARVRVFCVTGRIPARKIGQGWAMLNHDVAAFKAMERRDGRPSERSSRRP